MTVTLTVTESQVSESILVAFGAAEPIVRHVRAEIMRGQMGPDGWVDALKEIDAILDFAALTVYERFVVREAVISLINEQRALLNKPKPTIR
jgi:hypothetical protein